MSHLRLAERKRRGYSVEAVMMLAGVLLLRAFGLFGLTVWRLRFVE
jgi:hypothetical protein